RARTVPVPRHPGRKRAVDRGDGGGARALAGRARATALSARDDPREPVYLVGFMGAGKSTVGRVLTARLGWEFADVDALVESAEGREIEAIFRDSGEGRFREAEWDALRSLGGRRRLVVATGGGLFLGV